MHFKKRLLQASRLGQGSAYLASNGRSARGSIANADGATAVPKFEDDLSSIADDERGLVISAPTLLVDGTLISTGQLDAQELRFALLFWDKLEMPSNAAIRLGHTPDVEYLEDVGALQRTRATFDEGAAGTDFVLAAHLATFRHLDEHQPGKWSLARGVNSVSFPEDDLEEGRGLLFKLHQALTIPDREVPLNDILEFKQKHSSELIALRSELEDTYQRIRSAPDQVLAEGTEFAKLEQALLEHTKAMQDMKMPTRLASFTARIDLEKVIAGVGSAAASFSQGLDVIGAALTGAAGVGVNIGFGLRNRAPSSPFEYINTIHDNLH